MRTPIRKGATALVEELTQKAVNAVAASTGVAMKASVARLTAVLLSVAMIQVSFGPEAWAQLVPRVGAIAVPVGGGASAAAGSVSAGGLVKSDASSLPLTVSLTASSLVAPPAFLSAPSGSPSLSATGAESQAAAATPAASRGNEAAGEVAPADAPTDLSAPSIEEGPRATGIGSRISQRFAELKSYFGGKKAQTISSESAVAADGGPRRPVALKGSEREAPASGSTSSPVDAKPRVEAAKAAGFFGRLRQAVAQIRSLPSSFLWKFPAGWTMNSVGGEIQSVAQPLFATALFGLSTGLLINGIGYVSRIVGAWTGSYFMNRFNPATVNSVAIGITAVSSIAIGVAGLAGAASGVIFALFVANSVIGGLAYGVNRGVAESLIPRMILGAKDASKLEMGLNYAGQWVEIACIVASMFVAEHLLHLVGGSWMMAISGALSAASIFFYSAIKFAEPWSKPQKTAPAAAPVAGGPKKDGEIGKLEYLPLIFFRFMHFAMYGALATILAVSIFPTAGVAGMTIGLYDAGSWLLSLLATFALLPTKMGKKSWTVLGAAAAIAFLWSIVLFHVPMLTMALGGLLGGAVTINTNKWMADFSRRLPQERYQNLSKWVLTWGTLAVLPVFAAVSVVRVFPAIAAVVSMPVVLLGLAVAVTAAAALVLYSLHRTKTGASAVDGKGPVASGPAAATRGVILQFATSTARDRWVAEGGRVTRVYRRDPWAAAYLSEAQITELESQGVRVFPDVGLRSQSAK